MMSSLLVPYQISVHLEIEPHFKDVLFRGRFRLWGTEHLQAEHRGASGGGVQEQQLCQQYQGWAQPHPPRKGVFPVHQVPHHHLQQPLPPPAPLGAEEDLPEPHVEPTNISGPGESQLILCLNTNLPLNKNYPLKLTKYSKNTLHSTHIFRLKVLNMMLYLIIYLLLLTGTRNCCDHGYRQIQAREVISQPMAAISH